ncbi:sperm-associated antigen 1 isoform X2 [Nematostella vectensis]|uniref:sperm-associated antigen 1 isoform X2 n=1 Tax=Nematostella vectensis TaxID=45351 RepID=UPI0020773D2B|nr:sperm-associated antigen 1 isoform X2 [Nematostella vectensis]
MGTEGVYGTTKAGIPLHHLDYKYVGSCSDGKELEKILKVLRSGEEGTYPELIEFTEKRLEEVMPKSRALRKDLPAKSYRDLGKPEQEELVNDIEEWMTDISQLDSKLKTNSDAEAISDFLPPVRSSKTIGSTSSPSQATNTFDRPQGKQKGPVAPRSYTEWDKFDPDEEVKLLEEKEKQQVKEKKEKARINTREAKLPTNVKTPAKTDQELTFLANREKDKGNDAFRSGDYKESLVYYTRSIELKPTAASYNNRAMAEIKLSEYAKAIEDCNTVIFLEPDNLKAFLRRAIAQKQTGKVQAAKKDLNKVLEIEPNNKRAKELLEEITKENSQGKVAKEAQSKSESNPTSRKQGGGQRLKIVEVDEEEDDEEETEAADEEKIKTVNGLNGVERPAEKPMTNGVIEGALAKSGAENGLEFTSQNNRAKKDLGANIASLDTSSIAAPLSVNQNNQVAEKPPMEVASQPAPPSPPRDLPNLAVRAKDEGMRLYKIGRYAEAVEKYSQAIDVLWKDKSHFKSALASLLYNRASCLGRIGDASGCVKDCTSSLNLIPDSLKAHLKRAEQFEHLEKYKEAHFDYQAVLRIDPANQQALRSNNRVNSHLLSVYGPTWRTKITEAKPTSATSQALLDNEPQSTPASVYLSSGPQKVNKVETKPEPLKKSVAERFGECKERGNNFVKQGKHNEAVSCYTECISINPNEVASYTNRALCYLKLDKNDLAEKDANTALGLQPDNVKALYRRALARKALGKYDTAAKDLLSLVKIDSKNMSGKKELDTVLELCRKERRETQKSQPKGKTNSRPPANKEKPASGKTTAEGNNVRRRRVVIDEVNNDDEDSEEENASSKKTPCPASKKAPPNNQQAKKGGKDQPSKQAGNTTPTRGTKQKKIHLNKPTPYDFFQAWNTVRRNDLTSYAEILRQVEPKMLPKILSNKLDADMFRNMIGAISTQLIPNGEEKLSFQILQNVCQAQRFDMAIMFLGRQDIQDNLYLWQEFVWLNSDGKTRDLT